MKGEERERAHARARIKGAFMEAQGECWDKRSIVSHMMKTDKDESVESSNSMEF